MKKIFLASCLLILLISQTCLAAETMSKDKHEYNKALIIQKLQHSIKLLNQRKINEYMDFWAQHRGIAAIDPSSRRIIRGRKAITLYFSNNLSNQSVHLKMTDIDVIFDPDGHYAWVGAKILHTFKLSKQGAPYKINNWTIYRLEKIKNKWQITAAIYPFTKTYEEHHDHRRQAP